MLSVRLVLGFVFATFLRFLRFFPNNDPIIGLALPHSKKNFLLSAAFAFVCMFSFDIIVGKFGVWTLVTSSTYFVVILFLGFWFSKLKALGIKHYFFGSIIGVLVFDAITGPLMSTFLFNQPFLFTVLGQIPFTFYHLSSGVGYAMFFAFLFDPAVQKQVFKIKLFSRFFSPMQYFLLRFNKAVAW